MRESAFQIVRALPFCVVCLAEPGTDLRTNINMTQSKFLKDVSTDNLHRLTGCLKSGIFMFNVPNLGLINNFCKSFFVFFLHSNWIICHNSLQISMIYTF
jgi:hypothetical protein